MRASTGLEDLRMLSIRQHTSAYAIRQHTLAYVSIRQHTSAYVSIRQTTNMRASTGLEDLRMLSIRQHTSAYAIRQHALAYVRRITCAQVQDSKIFSPANLRACQVFPTRNSPQRMPHAPPRRAAPTDADARTRCAYAHWLSSLAH
jgi:hypothetical protein